MTLRFYMVETVVRILDILMQSVKKYRYKIIRIAYHHNTSLFRKWLTETYVYMRWNCFSP